MTDKTCTHLRQVTTVKQPEHRVCGHPVIASAEPGERWLFCYPDDMFASW